LFPARYQQSIREQLAAQQKRGAITEADVVRIISDVPQRKVKKRASAPEATEEQIQQAIMTALMLKGFIVLSTVHRRHLVRCECCEHTFYPPGGYGATKGIGDLIVSRYDWPDNTYILADVKSRTGKLTAEQERLFQSEKLYIWRSVEDALRDCEAASRRFTKEEDR
jgi:hypothetical protein